MYDISYIFYFSFYDHIAVSEQSVYEHITYMYMYLYVGIYVQPPFVHVYWYVHVYFVTKATHPHSA